MANGLGDLKLLERDAFRRYYEDGLLDIFFGLIMIVMGVSAGAAEAIVDRFDSELLGLTMIAVVGFGVAVPLLVIRRRLLRTRLGEFRPGPERRQRIRGTHAALLASVVLGVVAFGVGVVVRRDQASVETMEVLVPLLWFVNGVVVLGVMAHLLDVPRFYLYGLLWGAAMPLLVWPDMLWDFRIEPWIVFGGLGLPILAIGVYKLMRFLERYPAPGGSGAGVDGV